LILDKLVTQILLTFENFELTRNYSICTRLTVLKISSNFLYPDMKWNKLFYTSCTRGFDSNNIFFKNKLFKNRIFFIISNINLIKTHFVCALYKRVPINWYDTCFFQQRNKTHTTWESLYVTYSKKTYSDTRKNKTNKIFVDFIRWKSEKVFNLEYCDGINQHWPESLGNKMTDSTTNTMNWLNLGFLVLFWETVFVSSVFSMSKN